MTKERCLFFLIILVLLSGCISRVKGPAWDATYTINVFDRTGTNRINFPAEFADFSLTNQVYPDTPIVYTSDPIGNFTLDAIINENFSLGPSPVTGDYSITDQLFDIPIPAIDSCTMSNNPVNIIDFTGTTTAGSTGLTIALERKSDSSVITSDIFYNTATLYLDLTNINIDTNQIQVRISGAIDAVMGQSYTLAVSHSQVEVSEVVFDWSLVGSGDIVMPTFSSYSSSAFDLATSDIITVVDVSAQLEFLTATIPGLLKAVFDVSFVALDSTGTSVLTTYTQSGIELTNAGGMIDISASVKNLLSTPNVGMARIEVNNIEITSNGSSTVTLNEAETVDFSTQMKLTFNIFHTDPPTSPVALDLATQFNRGDIAGMGCKFTLNNNSPLDLDIEFIMSSLTDPYLPAVTGSDSTHLYRQFSIGASDSTTQDWTLTTAEIDFLFNNNALYYGIIITNKDTTGTPINISTDYLEMSSQIMVGIIINQ